MSRSKAYTVAGQAFRTQADLNAAVHAALYSHGCNVEFTDPFLQAVINEHHADLRAAGQHSTGRFEFLDWGEQVRRGLDSAERYRGGKLLRGWIEPYGGWMPVTAYPWKRGDPAHHIKKALREKAAAFLPHPTPADRCAREGCTATGFALEYEHVRPTFAEIADECLVLMTRAEIETKFAYNKFRAGYTELVHCIPDDHPAVEHLRARHRDNRWEWLCAGHHRNDWTRRPYAQPADIAATVARQIALPDTTA